MLFHRSCFLESVFHFSNDVWALGLMYYELVMKSLPLPLRQARTIQDLYAKIGKLKVSMNVADIKMQLSIDTAEGMI